MPPNVLFVQTFGRYRAIAGIFILAWKLPGSVWATAHQFNPTKETITMDAIAGSGESNGLIQSMSQRANERFATADVDNDGSVSRQEFDSVLDQKGIDASRGEKMFALLDADGSGDISQYEQRSAIQNSASTMNNGALLRSLLLENMSLQRTNEPAGATNSDQRTTASKLYEFVSQL